MGKDFLSLEDRNTRTYNLFLTLLAVCHLATMKRAYLRLEVTEDDRKQTPRSLGSFRH